MMNVPPSTEQRMIVFGDASGWITTGLFKNGAKHGSVTVENYSTGKIGRFRFKNNGIPGDVFTLTVSDGPENYIESWRVSDINVGGLISSEVKKIRLAFTSDGGVFGNKI